MADEGTILAMKDSRQRRVHRQIVQDRSERPLKLGFGGRFAVLSRRCHEALLMRTCGIVAMLLGQFQGKARFPAPFPKNLHSGGLMIFGCRRSIVRIST
jgi:hypothetical protein